MKLLPTTSKGLSGEILGCPPKPIFEVLIGWLSMFVGWLVGDIQIGKPAGLFFKCMGCA